MTIHWVGTGRCAAPGLQRLLDAGEPVVIWTRNPQQAAAALGERTVDLRPYAPEAIAAALQRGDVLVSMLPPECHPPLARLCVDRGAHFVCPSLLSAELATLDMPARSAGVTVLAGAGLSPGLDTLMARSLIADYQPLAAPGDAVSLTVHCGVVPKYPCPFRYRFAWCPPELLRNLRNPASTIRDGALRSSDRPWQDIGIFDAPLPTPERFETVPVGDAEALADACGLDPDWRLHALSRNTLRLKGWGEAWADVFAQLEPADDAAVAALAHRLAAEHPYAEGEPDRAVLCVAMQVRRGDDIVFDRGWVLDASGSGEGSAVARLVSTHAALAAVAAARGHLAAGVLRTPGDPVLVGQWLVELAELADHVAKDRRV